MKIFPSLESFSKRHPSVPSVMLGEMRSGDFWVSAKAAKGMVQFRAGPQKWVDIKYSLNSFDLKYVAAFCIRYGGILQRARALKKRWKLRGNF